MRRALLRLGSAVLILLVLAVGTLYGLSEYRLRRTYEIDLSTTLRADPAAAERGRRLAAVRGCVDCHGEDLGGRVFLDVAPVGRVFAPNLTRAGVVASYTDADWDRAVRHGVGPDGKPLLIMPSQEFHVLSDEDLAALVAYMRTVPPVERAGFDPSVGPIGRLLLLTGQAPLLPAELVDHEAPRPPAPAEAPSAEFGAYLATGCIGCHGEELSGGRIPGTPPEFPPATNITPDRATGIGDWTEAEFATLLRTGRRPDGTQVRPEMPWRLTAQMTDTEISAIWAYLQTVPPRVEGNR